MIRILNGWITLAYTRFHELDDRRTAGQARPAMVMGVSHALHQTHNNAKQRHRRVVPSSSCRRSRSPNPDETGRIIEKGGGKPTIFCVVPIMTAISRKTVVTARSSNTADSTKARLFLAVACLWPLCLLALFAASAPHVRSGDGSVGGGGGAAVGPGSSSRRQLGLQFRNILDRVDVMGYGPTHPRVAFALVGTDLADLETSVDSIFAHTDRNRLFIITVVVEGCAMDAQFVDRLTQLDRGTTKHWHGLRPDMHSANGAKQPSSDAAVDDHADQKIHVIFNAQPLGLAQARQDAVNFIQILEDTHEAQGLKSHEEDLILVLMQGGTRLVVRFCAMD
jgi:hypothetical protein